MNKELLFHVGLPKSGSTTFQSLLKEHPEVLDLGVFKRNDPLGNVLKGFYEDLVHKESICLDLDELKEQFIKHIQPEIERSSKNVSLLSYERVSSVFFSLPDRKVKAERIYTLFPNSKVLIILRNQFDIIKSQYRDHPSDPRYFKKGKVLKLSEWIQKDQQRKGNGYLDSLHYDKLVDYYKRIFGKERVKVLLFEEMIKDTEIFAEKLSKFVSISKPEIVSALTGKQKNKGVSSFYFWVRKLQRKILPNLGILSKYESNYVGTLKEILNSGKKKKVYYNQSEKNHIYKKFTETNHYLKDNYGLKVEKYNYPGF